VTFVKSTEGGSCHLEDEYEKLQRGTGEIVEAFRREGGVRLKTSILPAGGGKGGLTASVRDALGGNCCPVSRRAFLRSGKKGGLVRGGGRMQPGQFDNGKNGGCAERKERGKVSGGES